MTAVSASFLGFPFRGVVGNILWGLDWIWRRRGRTCKEFVEPLCGRLRWFFILWIFRCRGWRGWVLHARLLLIVRVSGWISDLRFRAKEGFWRPSMLTQLFEMDREERAPIPLTHVVKSHRSFFASFLSYGGHSPKQESRRHWWSGCLWVVGFVRERGCPWRVNF